MDDNKKQILGWCPLIVKSLQLNKLVKTNNDSVKVIKGRKEVDKKIINRLTDKVAGNEVEPVLIALQISRK